VKSFTNASTGTVTGTVLIGRGNVLNVNANGTTLLYDVVSQGVLTNAGTINGTVAADSVNNTGTIKVAAGSLAAISYGNPGSNGYANLSGTFVNSGTVTGNISVQSITNSGTINGDLLYGTDNGLVLPTKEGAIIGGVPTMRSVVATTLVNSGTVNGHIAMANGSINNTGTIAFGSAFNTSTITGSFTQSATGKLTFKINDAGQSDKLVINGAATIAGTLGVAAVDGQWNANRTYTVLTATGGLTGTFSNVDMNVAYLKPSVSYTANDVILAVARSTADIQENVVTETTAQQVSTSSRRVAQAVDARVDEAISAAFVALPSLEQKTSSLPGLISGVNAGDTTNAMWGTWATFTPTFQKQALVLPGQTSAQAVNGTSLSFLAGVDRIIGSRTVVGSFFSYEDSDFDLTGTNGKRSGHGPVIGAYAGLVITNWLNASAQVNHGWFSNSLAEGAYGVVPVTGSFDSQRIMTSETLTAHKVYDKFFNGADVNLSAKLGYSFTRETFDHYTASDGAPVSPGATRLGRVVVGGEAAGWGTAFTPYLQVTYEWDVQTSSSGDKDGAVVGIGGRYRTGSMTFDLYGSTQVGRRQERSKSVGINARYAF
jgi:outer membrane autotransporter protein